MSRVVLKSSQAHGEIKAGDEFHSKIELINQDPLKLGSLLDYHH